MDIHGGKAIIDGPHNYMGELYRAVPIGITVEGANILTRKLIVFGQGAIRSHPYLLKEMIALEEPDHERGARQFDEAFWNMSATALTTCCARWWPQLDAAVCSRRRRDAGAATPYYRQLSRYSAAFRFRSRHGVADAWAAR